MIIGISYKYSYGWIMWVVKFRDQISAETWLNTEQQDFRERELFESEEEAIKFLSQYMSVKKAKRKLELASTMFLTKDGILDEEFSEAYIYKMMTGERD